MIITLNVFYKATYAVKHQHLYFQALSYIAPTTLVCLFVCFYLPAAAFRKLK